MKPEQLQAIKERERKAMPSPWFTNGENEISIEHNGRIGFMVRGYDAEFIAHARQDIPALISEVERLQELLKGNDGMSVLEIREQFVHLHRQLLKEQEKSNKYCEALQQILEDEASNCDGYETFIHTTVRKALEVRP